MGASLQLAVVAKTERGDRMNDPERAAKSLIQELHCTANLSQAQMVPLSELIALDSLATMMIRSLAEHSYRIEKEAEQFVHVKENRT